MSGADPTAAIGATAQAQISAGGAFAPAPAQPSAPEGANYADLLSRGAAEMEARIDRADQLVRAFATDDSIPVHEVTIALEEARIAVELALQVRTRLIEGYRDIMNMQL